MSGYVSDSHLVLVLRSEDDWMLRIDVFEYPDCTDSFGFALYDDDLELRLEGHFVPSEDFIFECVGLFHTEPFTEVC